VIHPATPANVFILSGPWKNTKSLTLGENNRTGPGLLLVSAGLLEPLTIGVLQQSGSEGLNPNVLKNQLKLKNCCLIIVFRQTMQNSRITADICMRSGWMNELDKVGTNMTPIIYF
jgi:hypothetical protein